MMNIANDILTLKEQGMSDKDIVELLKLKGAKEQDIISQLNDFYTKKSATQITDEPLGSASLPILQIIILVLLIIIASVLGWFIMQGQIM